MDKDPVEGELWLRRAAETGHAHSMRMLGNHIIQGDVREQDCEEGEAWLWRAADTGHPVFMAMLGIQLLLGDGLEQDVEEGEYWLQRAVVASAGDPRSMRLLTELFDLEAWLGRGSEQ